MEDIFSRASLSYLTNRCDEGFELIYAFIATSNDDRICLNGEEQQVFCLISMNIIDKRYQSWIRLNRLLVQTDSPKQRQLTQNYLQVILNEMNSYANKVHVLIEKSLLNDAISIDDRISYLKIEGDVHFLISQTSKSEEKLHQMYSSLAFYDHGLELCRQNAFDRKFLSITYNKALVLKFISLN